MVFARKSKTTKFEDYDDVLNQDEAARLLGVSVPTLCKTPKNGRYKIPKNRTPNPYFKTEPY